jgi:hypothetical protein
MQVRNLGKGKGIAAAPAAPQRAPDPAVNTRSSESQRGSALGISINQRILEDQVDHNLPYQRSAPGEAAGSSSDTQMSYVGPAGPARCESLSRRDIQQCLQCNEPSAIINLWHLRRLLRNDEEEGLFPSSFEYKNCYDEHTHYCCTRALFGWQRLER